MNEFTNVTFGRDYLGCTRVLGDDPLRILYPVAFSNLVVLEVHLKEVGEVYQLLDVGLYVLSHIEQVEAVHVAL